MRPKRRGRDGEGTAKRRRFGERVSGILLGYAFLERGKTSSWEASVFAFDADSRAVALFTNN